MILFSIECSAKTASAAVFNNGKLLAEEIDTSGKTHSETLLPLAEKMLKTNGITFSMIDEFAVTTGPGSFTGLRIGLAAIKGLAGSKPVTPLSTLEVIAKGVTENAVICAVMDARCNQFYNALFENKNGVLTRLTPDRAVGAEELYNELKNYKNVVVAGDGANVFCSIYPCFTVSGVIQTAKSAGLLALEKLKKVTAKELVCNYLRLPKAERELKEKQANK